MRRWTVRDRRGHEIYLTEERWRHITERHDELIGHLDDVLDTVRRGRRRQEPLAPQSYRYYWRCDTLPRGYTHIMVIVASRFRTLPDGTVEPNDFIVTAWGKARREGR
ncbi:MAG: hypothetical protein ISS49_12690 [Anaerolineae bacterium]|nr:hypothetical protein [Anaerolineae bacterium]